MFVFSTVHVSRYVFYSQQGVEESTVLTKGKIILWAGGSLANDGSNVKTSVPIFNCVDEHTCLYSQQCVDEDMCSYSQQFVKENTVLTEGKIILWAGGSLADDGSTVKTRVPIFNSAWMKINVRILNSAWMKIGVHILNSVWRKTVLTQGRIILWA